MTLQKMFDGAENSVGALRFWNQNSQLFMKSILQQTTAWNSSVEQFVMKNAEKVLDGMGFLAGGGQNMEGRGTEPVAHRRCYGGRR